MESLAGKVTQKVESLSFALKYIFYQEQSTFQV